MVVSSRFVTYGLLVSVHASEGDLALSSHMHSRTAILVSFWMFPAAPGKALLVTLEK